MLSTDQGQISDVFCTPNIIKSSKKTLPQNTGGCFLVYNIHVKITTF